MSLPCTRPLALALAALCVPAAHAQPIEATSLDRISVVASPIIESNEIDAHGSLTTVVGAQQIRDLNALDLSSALRRTPGVTVSRFNPVGAFGGGEGGAVYIRGQGASRPGSEIKTYIDGIPFYMGVWDHPLLDLLPVHAVQQINVLKGPQPHRYGNTFSAIDLTTTAAPDQGQRNGLQLTGGSYGTVTENALLSGRTGDIDYVVAQGYARSDGARSHGEGRLLNGMAKLGYRVDDHWRVGLTLLSADNRVSDPGEVGRPETRSGQFNTRGTLITATVQHMHDAASGELSLYRNSGRGSALSQPGLDGDTLSDFDLKGIRWTESVQAGRGTVSGGVDIDQIDGTVRFQRVSPAPAAYFRGPSLRIAAPHLAYAHPIDLGGRWTLTPSAGLRAYDHNVFENTLAPHAGVLLSDGPVSLRMNASRGVNYPGQGVVVLSSLIPALAESWKGLKPETSKHVEIGARFELAPGVVVDASLFQDDYRNRYVFAFPPAVAMPMFTNLGSYRMRGGEATVTAAAGEHAELFAGFTWLDADLAQAPYAPRRALSAGVNTRWQAWRLSADAQYQDAMYVLGKARSAEGSGFSRVSPFAVVNLRVARSVAALGNEGEVFVAVENLLDRNYAYRTGYPMPGRNAQLGLRIGF